jgi:hypothetical protein
MYKRTNDTRPEILQCNKCKDTFTDVEMMEKLKFQLSSNFNVAHQQTVEKDGKEYYMSCPKCDHIHFLGFPNSPVHDPTILTVDVITVIKDEDVTAVCQSKGLYPKDKVFVNMTEYPAPYDEGEPITTPMQGMIDYGGQEDGHTVILMLLKDGDRLVYWKRDDSFSELSDGKMKISLKDFIESWRQSFRCKEVVEYKSIR